MPSDPPSTAPMSRHGLGDGSPENPIPPCSRGQAFALAAAAVDILTGTPQRLAWKVDLTNDVVLTEYDLQVEPTEPTGNARKNSWGDLLFRLRSALDKQAWGSYKCEFAMILGLQARSTLEKVWCTFAIPWTIDLTCIPGRQPMVGAWRLLQLPPRQERSMSRVGDLQPADWWVDGLPF